MNYKNTAWNRTILYLIVWIGIVVGMFVFCDAARDEVPVECFEGVFAERLQPHVETIWMQQVWLCGNRMHYQFLQPDEDVILNQRTPEYYEQKEQERDSVH